MKKLIALGCALLIAACSTGTTLSTSQVVADAKGAVATLMATEAAIVVADPGAISAATQAQINQAANDAMAALNGLGTAPDPKTAASTMQTIEVYFNDALVAIGAVLAADPVLNAQYGVAFDAVQALIINIIEPYINSLVPNPTPVASFVKH